MYSIRGYEEMIDDAVRMDAYVAALRRIITPERVLLDIGAGTGMISLIACRLGAKHVFAVEPDNAIAVAKERARANHLENRITFIQDLSTRITLPVKVDIIVSDLRGVSPLFTEHIPSIVHARKKHLATGGYLIPQKDRLWVALTEALPFPPEPHRWNRDQFALDLSAANRYLANSWIKHRSQPTELLSQPMSWATLEYSTIASPDVNGTVRLSCLRNGLARGLVAWFDTQLLDDIGYSNAPGRPKAIYGMQYFPLESPVEVTNGDVADVTLSANRSEADYHWIWDTRFYEGDSPRVRAEFQQSTFFGVPLSREYLAKSSEQFTPTVGLEAKIDYFVLEQMHLNRKVGEIALALVKQFPQKFSEYQTGLDRVARLSRLYTE